MLNNSLYMQTVKKAAGYNIDWNIFKDKSIMISGATGMIGSFLVDTLMYKNINEALNCKVYALGRNEERAHNRFGKYEAGGLYNFIACDINYPLAETGEKIDYIIHAASNTHPVAYAKYPVETILTNIVGTNNLLDYAVKHGTQRFVFLSTVEIYGKNRGDQKEFTEDYCGYIDCNTTRAGYPESKRAGEALCQAYIAQHGLDVVIPRLPRVYGPTMLASDSKASAQFIRNSLNKENIVLKSDGMQNFSYGYVPDVVTGILVCIEKGQCGEAYNIADKSSDILLRDFARIAAEMAGTEVVFDIPDSTEAKGFSNSVNGILNSEKLKSLGWKAEYSIEEGIKETIGILSEKSVVE